MYHEMCPLKGIYGGESPPSHTHFAAQLAHRALIEIEILYVQLIDNRSR